ncbi:MAG: histidine triad (HIT) protein [Chloroflexi bacterium]|nr:MAG: histidine triad (HIT) protein [Chloroflexota bacterium]
MRDLREAPRRGAAHAQPGEDGRASLGYLFIESERHAPHLDDLTDEEAAALGRLRTRLARALRIEVAALHVFAAVIGRNMDHFHEQMVARYPDTPADVPWHRSDEFAPRANAEEVADLARRLARRLAGDDGPQGVRLD